MWRRSVGLLCLCLVACGESGREPVVGAPPLAASPTTPKAPEAAADATAANAAPADRGAPAREQIIDWWKRKSDEEIEVFDVKAVQLLSRETVYLAGITLGGRGKNAEPGALLVRPGQQEVVEVKSSIGPEFQVLDLDGDGVSEIVSSVAGFAQGSTEGEKYILQLQDDKPVVLHKAEFSESARSDRNGGTETESIRVEWKFSSEGNVPVLQELIMTRESLCPANGTCREKTEQRSNTYRYLNRQFLKSASTP